MKIGIFYGSTTGMTEAVAESIAAQLGVAAEDVHNVSDLSAESVAPYDLLLLGGSTWGAGDLQDDWYDGVDTLRACDLSGKKVAVFGCGDSASYPDTFCSALAQMADAATEGGATLVGEVSTEGYTFDESESVRDGKFVGLALDETNESDQTADRIANWVATLK